MTTKEEILKAYKEGFQDGWKMAMDELKDFTEKSNGKIYPTIPEHDPTNPFAPRGPVGPWAPKDNNIWSTCPVCKRTGMTGVICNVPNCPTTAYSYSTGTIGAAGSDRNSNLPLGANGPTSGDKK